MVSTVGAVPVLPEVLVDPDVLVDPEVLVDVEVLPDVDVCGAVDAGTDAEYVGGAPAPGIGSLCFNV